MAPTYPDFSRVHSPLDVPPYAKDIDCFPPYRGEKPIPFTFPNDLPVRTRVSAHRVDEDYIRKYNRAVQLMKELPPDDPRNFTQQASVHCAYCQGSYFMDTTDKPFTIHGGWFFQPWHRWFIYFHERMLMKLLGDDTFALPYWNWDFEEGMTIPPIYMNEELSVFHPVRNRARGPASIVDLSFSNLKAPSSDQDQIDFNYRLMYKQMVAGAKTTRSFHGAPRRSTGSDSGCTCVKGTLEMAPHNTVHSWVGNPITKQCPCPTRTCYGEDMGVFYAAARDPIFYAHHANLDRMWTIWQKLPGRKDYNDPDLLDTQFFFYDENARLVSVRAGDAFDNRKLRYRYQDIPTPWLRKQPNPELPLLYPTGAASRLLYPTGAAGRPLLRQHDLEFFDAATVSLSLPSKRSLKFMGGEELLLLIEGIRVQRNLAVKFDVFINLDDRLLSTSYVDAVPREFVGTYVALPRGARDDVEVGCGQSSMWVGISEVLRDLKVKEGGNIMVTLVPKVKVDDPIRVSSIKLLEYVGKEFGGKYFGQRWWQIVRSVVHPSKWRLCPPLDHLFST